MANKPNPLLAKMEAKLEAEYQTRLRFHSEIDRIAVLVAANRELKVGPGRAPGFLDTYRDTKVEIAKMIKEDVGDGLKKGGNGDPEFLQSKRDIAVALRNILGPEAWQKYKYDFPMVEEYWDD